MDNNGIANSVSLDQTAPVEQSDEQSDEDLHCF